MTPVSLVVNRIHWLSEKTFEVAFQRPAGFENRPGQKVSLGYEDITREYTLVNGPHDGQLTICVRHVDQGRLSPVLARAQKGDRFQASAAFGHFSHQPSPAVAVFVATGTGVAPFVSFARSGVGGFYLLHGVRTLNELYYRDLLQRAAHRYIPCLSEDNTANRNVRQVFIGRVTDYLEENLPNGVYDFYLCGRGEMMADATRIIDTLFDGSKVFSERFY